MSELNLDQEIKELGEDAGGEVVVVDISKPLKFYAALLRKCPLMNSEHAQTELIESLWELAASDAYFEFERKALALDPIYQARVKAETYDCE